MRCVGRDSARVTGSVRQRLQLPQRHVERVEQGVQHDRQIQETGLALYVVFIEPVRQSIRRWLGRAPTKGSSRSASEACYFWRD